MDYSEEYVPCPEDRCPLCWYANVDSLKAEGCDYCEEHEERVLFGGLYYPEWED